MRFVVVLGRILFLLFFLIFSPMGLGGCGYPISRDVLTAVEKKLTFAVVIQNPRAYIGGIVLWGGVIEEMVQGSEGTDLVVIETPLDSEGYPQTHMTEGEFIAQTHQPLDPQVYKKGMTITLAGEIDSVEEKESGWMEYPVPVIRILEIHPWEKKLWGIIPFTLKGWKLVPYSPPSPSPFRFEDYP